VNVYIAEKFRIVKAAKTRQNAVSKLAINICKHILESIKNNVEKKTDKVAKRDKVEEFDNRRRNADNDIPLHVHCHHWLKNNRAKYKRIDVEVYMVRNKTEEFNAEQQEAGTTTLADPQNTKNDVDVGTAKKTKVKQVAETILATNTEATKIETPDKFENNTAKGGANNQPL
jgi:hypothetical protein